MSDITRTELSSDLPNKEWELNHTLTETSENLNRESTESLGTEDDCIDVDLLPTDNCFHSIFGADTPDWTKREPKIEKDQSENASTMVSSANDGSIQDNSSVPADTKTFLSQKHYKQYQSTLKTKIKCPNCFFTTINRGNLKQHMKKHEKPEGYVYTCESCDFTTKYKNSMKGHSARHEKGRSGPKRRKK